jgi:hypothetical protein
MAQMQRSKVGSRKKGRRSAKKKPYYTAYRSRYSGKLIRARGKREKQIAFFEANPTQGSPSQIRMRNKNEKRKNANKRKNKENTSKNTTG